MNCKWFIVISITLMILSLASVSASELDQSAIHGTCLYDCVDADDLDTDSSLYESLDINENVPDLPSDNSRLDDDDGTCDASSSDDDEDNHVSDDSDSSEDIDDEATDDGEIPVSGDSDSSADDVNDDSINSDDNPVDSDITDGDSIIRNMTNDIVKPKYNDEPISNIKEGSGSFDDLQVLIDLMPNGGTLVLACDYKGAEDNQVTINKDICIDGAGHTIDCAGLCRAFYSIEGKIVLKNIRLINGCYDTYDYYDSSNNGGAIWIGGSAAYTIINCSFINNWADDYGGAIYNDAERLLKIINCTFDSNEADDASGGAIYSKGEVYVENSTFNGNKAYHCGGALYLPNNDVSALSKIINSIFTSNTVETEYSAGAVYCFHNLFIDGSTFTSNGGSPDYGGAITCSKNLIVQNSLFQDNNAEWHGGAIEAHGNTSLSNCTFISNKVDGSALDAKGGAVWSFNDLYIDNCTFDKNWADDLAGAIYARGKLFINYFQADDGIYNTFFNENTADDDYGGAIECDGIAYIKNTKFFANRAYTDAGAIYAMAEAYITHCLFDSNRCTDASSYCQGGAIYTEKTLNIMDCIFKDNYAEDDGGAIYSEGTVNIDNSTFMGNSAEDYGGAIYAKTVNINKLNEACKSFFINNHAKDDQGGAIYAEDSVCAYNTEFRDNSALVDGGAIWAKNVNVNKCSFDNNRAEGAKSKCYGGAIRAGAAKVYDCVFNNNFAENHGGAIFTDTFSEAVKYCTFYNNQAKEDGGAVYVNNENNVRFDICNFLGNQAGDEGGAVYLDSDDSHLSLINNLISGNHANDGHVVYNKGFYDSICNNWWGAVNPSSDNNMLVEWKFWTSNINHVDSDPLRMVLELDHAPSYVGEIDRATAYFVKSDGSRFNGELSIGDFLTFSLGGLKAIDSGHTANSVFVDFLAEKTGIYNIVSDLYGTRCVQLLVVFDSKGLSDSKVPGISNDKADSNMAKDILPNIVSYKKIFASSNGGLNGDFNSVKFNAGSIYGHFDDASIINQGAYNNIVKSMDIVQSNSHFMMVYILKMIFSIFGF